MFKTPLLVETRGLYEDYLKSLSRKAKKNYKATMKEYGNLWYGEGGWDPTLIENFMRRWENQLIRGEKRKWAFGIDYLESIRGRLHVFYALNEDSIIACQFVELHGNYLECHPPMYDKTQHKGLAKFMWFNLIRYAHATPGVNFIDLGGGYRGSWRDLIRDRHLHPNTAYKWMYVPEAVKENPLAQPAYYVNEQKELIICEENSLI